MTAIVDTNLNNCVKICCIKQTSDQHAQRNKFPYFHSAAAPKKKYISFFKTIVQLFHSKKKNVFFCHQLQRIFRRHRNNKLSLNKCNKKKEGTSNEV